ncbi:MBL fold metallo-hydrolase [Winogradskyella alexanderae]|uniref:MBL fold metallo-hydrolase n=1 Tax=Winogradskyella alexanderae TaxID=2877123 RepID=A0ABS7XUM5_9FLAO|nr:MBL fold metallo-hydrolase [Winogradskyella alexanderae]MCA0133727.1 MBL fold metallo-hydrolase [Winogradskyella alexanderae]
MNTLKGILICSFVLILNCQSKAENEIIKIPDNNKSGYEHYITILGIAQDAGYPQIHCKKSCCIAYYEGNESKKLVSCLGLVDTVKSQKWLFDATPDIVEQSKILSRYSNSETVADGIFLTHAHIGHYTGLMFLGREALGSNNIPVYAMPRMKQFLETNGPWNQLVDLNNIKLKQLKHDSVVHLNKSLEVKPFLVPHRDEYSETVGYKIIGAKKSALFIPDIDKWETWDKSIIEEVKKVDYAFLDASFFKDGELDRDMSKIPHPFTTQTTTLFENESMETKNKIYFIHFNHTNPTIRDSHPLKDSILGLGFNFAREGAIFGL